MSAQPQQSDSVRGRSLVARELGGGIGYRPQEEILSFGEVRVAGTIKVLRTGTHPQNSRGTRRSECGKQLSHGHKACRFPEGQLLNPIESGLGLKQNCGSSEDTHGF